MMAKLVATLWHYGKNWETTIKMLENHWFSIRVWAAGWPPQNLTTYRVQKICDFVYNTKCHNFHDNLIFMKQHKRIFFIRFKNVFVIISLTCLSTKLSHTLFSVWSNEQHKSKWFFIHYEMFDKWWTREIICDRGRVYKKKALRITMLMISKLWLNQEKPKRQNFKKKFTGMVFDKIFQFNLKLLYSTNGCFQQCYLLILKKFLCLIFCGFQGSAADKVDL
jgi:hypothetical protein